VRRLQTTRLHKKWLRSLRAGQLQNRLHPGTHIVRSQSESLICGTMMINHRHQGELNLKTSSFLLVMTTKSCPLNETVAFAGVARYAYSISSGDSACHPIQS
jgi:hypothetical protein